MLPYCRLSESEIRWKYGGKDEAVIENCWCWGRWRVDSGQEKCAVGTQGMISYLGCGFYALWEESLWMVCHINSLLRFYDRNASCDSTDIVPPTTASWMPSHSLKNRKMCSPAWGSDAFNTRKPNYAVIEKWRRDFRSWVSSGRCSSKGFAATWGLCLLVSSVLLIFNQLSVFPVGSDTAIHGWNLKVQLWFSPCSACSEV